MEKSEISGKEPGQLAAYLAMVCEDREAYKHLRSLTEEELTEKRENFSDRAIKISKIEIELAIAKKNFKERLSPLYVDQDKVLNVIEAGEDWFNDTCYPIYDFESGKVELYNEDGILLHIRPLTPAEHQLRIEMASESAAEKAFESISMEDIIPEEKQNEFAESLSTEKTKVTIQRKGFDKFKPKE